MVIHYAPTLLVTFYQLRPAVFDFWFWNQNCVNQSVEAFSGQNLEVTWWSCIFRIKKKKHGRISWMWNNSSARTALEIKDLLPVARVEKKKSLKKGISYLRYLKRFDFIWLHKYCTSGSNDRERSFTENHMEYHDKFLNVTWVTWNEKDLKLHLHLFSCVTVISTLKPINVGMSLLHACSHISQYTLSVGTPSWEALGTWRIWLAGMSTVESRHVGLAVTRLQIVCFCKELAAGKDKPFMPWGSTKNSIFPPSLLSNLRWDNCVASVLWHEGDGYCYLWATILQKACKSIKPLIII